MKLVAEHAVQQAASDGAYRQTIFGRPVGDFVRDICAYAESDDPRKLHGKRRYREDLLDAGDLISFLLERVMELEALFIWEDGMVVGIRFPHNEEEA